MVCRTLDDGQGGTIIACTRGGTSRRCATCGRQAEALCDYPLSASKAGRTCDRPMCGAHRTRVGDDLDHCPAHARFAADPATLAEAAKAVELEDAMKDHEREKLRARAFATGRTIRGTPPEQAPLPSMDVILPPRPGSRGNLGHGSSTTTEAPMPADPKPQPAASPTSDPVLETKDDGFKVSVSGWMTLKAQMEHVGGKKYEGAEAGMSVSVEAPSAPGQADRLAKGVRAFLRAQLPGMLAEAIRLKLQS